MSREGPRGAERSREEPRGAERGRGEEPRGAACLAADAAGAARPATARADPAAALPRGDAAAPVALGLVLVVKGSPVHSSGV